MMKRYLLLFALLCLCIGTFAEEVVDDIIYLNSECSSIDSMNMDLLMCTRNDGKIDVVKIKDDAPIKHTYDMVDEQLTKLGIKAKIADDIYYLNIRTGDIDFVVTEDLALNDYFVCQKPGNISEYYVVSDDYKILASYAELLPVDDNNERFAITASGHRDFLNRKGEIVYKDVRKINDFYIESDSILYYQNDKRLLYNGKLASIDGDIVRFWDAHKKVMISFDTKNLKVGMCVDGNDFFVGDISYKPEQFYYQDGSANTMVTVFNNLIEKLVYNSKGNRIWNELDVSDFEYFTFSDDALTAYFLIATPDAYYLGNDDGNLLNTKFSIVRGKYCTFKGSDGKDLEGRIELIDGRLVVVGDEFNYNTYTWYYDIEKRLFGKIDENDKILSAATSKSKIVSPITMEFVRREGGIFYKKGNDRYRIFGHANFERPVIEIVYLPRTVNEYGHDLFLIVYDGRILRDYDGEFGGYISIDQDKNLHISGCSVGSFNGTYLYSED